MDMMSLRGLVPVCAVLLAGVLGSSAQLPSAPQPQANAGQAAQKQTTPDAQSSSSSPQPSSDDSSAEQQQTPNETTAKKQPSKLKRALNRAKPNCAHIGGTESCWDKNPREKEAEQERKREAEEAQSKQPRNQAPPRSTPPEGQSSSRDSQVDLSPPPDDMMHEGADVPSDVTEFHSYDPHKAAKNVEVGDFYFDKKNYRAAESRYEEALQWKPNDAIATFRLAVAEEKLGKKQDAVKNYEAYLKLLPQGEFAVQAKSGLERLKSTETSQK
jgi:tetratricopeptide (TPR) repeat protein